MDEERILEKLQTRLWNLELEHPLVLGAGIAKYIRGPEGLETYLNSAHASLLLAGSFTLRPRAGNPGEVCWSSEDGRITLNRMGLPNQGAMELTEHLPPQIPRAHQKGRFVGISVASDPAHPESPAQQYAQLARLALEAGADMVELNLSCPNTESEPIAFNPPEVEAILAAAQEELGPEAHLCMKVSPYSDGRMIRGLAALANRYPVIKGVATTNTFPNALYLDQGRPVISSNEGLAGLSGPGLFPIALGQVAQWRKVLDPDKYLLGGGGVTQLQDVLDMLQAGATAVFLVSAVLTHKPTLFHELLESLIAHYSGLD